MNLNKVFVFMIISVLIISLFIGEATSEESSFGDRARAWKKRMEQRARDGFKSVSDTATKYLGKEAWRGYKDKFDQSALGKKLKSRRAGNNPEKREPANMSD